MNQPFKDNIFAVIVCLLLGAIVFFALAMMAGCVTTSTMPSERPQMKYSSTRR